MIKLGKASDKNVNLVVADDVLNISKKTDDVKNYAYDKKINDIVLPIKKNDKLGTLYVKENGSVIKEIDLVAEKDIEKQGFFKFFLNNFKDMLVLN